MNDGREDAGWLAAAVELAVRNVHEGGGPFGAVIVRDGEQIGAGQNRVTRDNDPTAHAEVLAIRAACAAVGDFSLTGATLYTSCEPCPLCMSAALWARLDRVVYARDAIGVRPHELPMSRDRLWRLARDAARGAVGSPAQT